MRLSGRLQAAIEVLEAILERHQPAATALADWGRAHRIAGSGDRAAIGNLVYDALRRRASLAHAMGSDAPRSLALAALHVCWTMPAGAIEELANGSRHAPQALSEAEKRGLAGHQDVAPPAHVAGDYPEWLSAAFERTFGAQAAQEGAALARRAPVDMRANTLKTTRDKLLEAMASDGATATPLSPLGVRIKPPVGAGRSPNVEASNAHGRGWFEIQDEGSQIAALLGNAKPRCQVADICAGAGGKTLALAASMENSGQIHAFDMDKHRLRPIFERLQRAGVRNAQVLEPGKLAHLNALAGRMDLVLADAPCTGSGVWRRRPDAKWRLKPAQLDQRLADQRSVLALGAPLVKPGGRLVYVTCSVLCEENTGQIDAFLAANPDFSVLPYADAWAANIGTPPPKSADGRTDTLLLTPARHGTDGFFVGILQRNAV